MENFTKICDSHIVDALATVQMFQENHIDMPQLGSYLVAKLNLLPLLAQDLVEMELRLS